MGTVTLIGTRLQLGRVRSAWNFECKMSKTYNRAMMMSLEFRLLLACSKFKLYRASHAT